MSGRLRFNLVTPQITNENRVCVYKITFECGMFYIGSSINLYRRAVQYRYNFYNRHDINKKLKAALNSHNSAVMTILEVCNDEKTLRDMEDFYIKSNFDNPHILNRSKSAYSNRSKKFPDEAYASGNYMRGRKMPQETKDKISQTTKGKIFSEETKIKLSAAAKGRVFSDEHKKKLSIAKTGRVMPESEREKRRGKTNIPVDMFTLDGAFIESFSSYSDAAKKIGSRAGHIGEAVNGKYKSLKGYIFANAKISSTENNS